MRINPEAGWFVFSYPLSGKGPKGGSTGPSVSSTIGDDGGSEMKWFARSKGSRIVPLRTLMLDSEVHANKVVPRRLGGVNWVARWMRLFEDWMSTAIHK